MNNFGHTSSIFDSFNARNLDPYEVARKFVPSQQYNVLAKRSHSIIVGPRGSGKTTLLKMLQAPALETWKHEKAEEFRQKVDYTGVFVATDVSWSAQINSLGKGTLGQTESEQLSVAAFTTHVLRSLIIAMSYRVHGPVVDGNSHRRVNMDADEESRIVDHLAQSWYLSPTIPSFSALKLSLSGRLSEIRQIASRLTLMSVEKRASTLESIDFLHLHFLDAASIAIELFNDEAGQETARWALLFDELELAPQWIVDQLICSLRSYDERFLFKLSMSPFRAELGQLKDATSAMPGNDFDIIPLWYAHKEDGYQFCNELFKSMVQERGLSNLSPSELLGPSEFDTRSEDGKATGVYNLGARLQSRFLRLSVTDSSFKQYLKERKIDPKNLSASTGAARASDIRKVAPLVTVRDAFLTLNSEGSSRRQRIRSRKNPHIYAGATSLFAIVEGNPRWFIGVVGRLLDEVSQENTLIPPSRQSNEILSAANRFRALLRTIPTELAANSQGRGLLKLLDNVGEYFFERAILDDFSPDPPGSFIVDANCSQPLLKTIEQALNAGAIVYVAENDSDLIMASLRGKRFRISYLLAPYYHIPLRLGGARSLHGILTRAGKSSHQSLEPSLFDIKEMNDK